MMMTREKWKMTPDILNWHRERMQAMPTVLLMIGDENVGAHVYLVDNDAKTVTLMSKDKRDSDYHEFTCVAVTTLGYKMIAD
jgi:hypothetical protein